MYIISMTWASFLKKESMSLRKKDYLSFKALIESEIEKIMNDPEALERIYDKIDERLEIKNSNENHA